MSIFWAMEFELADRPMSQLADGVVRRSGVSLNSGHCYTERSRRVGVPAPNARRPAIRCNSALVVPPRLRGFRCYP